MKTITNKDPRDEQIATLEAKLAKMHAGYMALAPRNPREQAVYDRRIAEAKAAEEDRLWRELPDSASRIKAFGVIVSDYTALRFLRVLTEEDLISMVRAADSKTLARLRRVHPGWRHMEIQAIRDEDLPRWLRITTSGPGIGSDRIEITAEQAELLSKAGIPTTIEGRALRTFYGGLSMGRDNPRPYWDELADAWDTRLSIDVQLAALVLAGQVIATRLSPSEVRQKLLRGVDQC